MARRAFGAQWTESRQRWRPFFIFMPMIRLFPPLLSFLRPRLARWRWPPWLRFLPLPSRSRCASAWFRPLANEATEKAIALAARQGLEVKLVEFNDWVLPNIAVADGSVDANFFQHEPFLQVFNARRGVKLVPIAYGYSTIIGLYSKKLKRGEPLPEGATVAVPNDPVNTGRALLLLQSMGLIGLKPGVGNMAAVEDVTLNPKRLKFVPVEGAQSARTFDDVTASVTYPSFARQAGLSEQDCLGFDNNSPDSVRRYAIRWVTTPERANDPRLLKFIAIYQESPEVKATLRRLYGDLIVFPGSAARRSIRAQTHSPTEESPCLGRGSGTAGAQCENMIGTVMVFRIEAVAPPMAHSLSLL